MRGRQTCLASALCELDHITLRPTGLLSSSFLRLPTCPVAARPRGFFFRPAKFFGKSWGRRQAIPDACVNGLFPMFVQGGLSVGRACHPGKRKPLQSMSDPDNHNEAKRARSLLSLCPPTRRARPRNRPGSLLSLAGTPAPDAVAAGPDSSADVPSAPGEQSYRRNDLRPAEDIREELRGIREAVRALAASRARSSRDY